MSCGKSCDCNERLGTFAEKLSDETLVWTHAEIQAVEDLLFCTLSCVERHHPDYVVRMAARAQLADPWWDRQKARSIALRVQHSLDRENWRGD